MAERQQREAGVDAGAAGVDEGPAAGLRRLLDSAHAAPLADRPAAVARLDRALAALPRSEAAARALLELLGAGRLAGLEEAGGVTSRAEAVRALLRLGYPWALEVDPLDLAWLRAEDRRRRPRQRWLVLVLVALLGAGAGAYLAFHPAPPPPDVRREVRLPDAPTAPRPPRPPVPAR